MVERCSLLGRLEAERLELMTSALFIFVEDELACIYRMRIVWRSNIAEGRDPEGTERRGCLPWPNALLHELHRDSKGLGNRASCDMRF